MVRQERNWRISEMSSKTAIPAVLRNPSGGRFEEIPVLRAKNVGFANDRGLHDDSVVYVENRCDRQTSRDHDFGGLAQETHVIVDALLRKAVERQHSRIAQDPRQLVEHLWTGAKYDLTRRY